MVKTYCEFKDKDGNVVVLKNDGLQTKVGRILENGVSLKEQRRRLHNMKKEDLEYEA